MSNNDVFDIKRLDSICGDDNEFRLELISDFKENIKELVSGLKGAAKNGDIETIREQAHSLKGSSANLGAGDLTNISLAVEMAAKIGDLETAIKEVDKLDQAVVALLAAIK